MVCYISFNEINFVAIAPTKNIFVVQKLQALNLYHKEA